MLVQPNGDATVCPRPRSRVILSSPGGDDSNADMRTGGRRQPLTEARLYRLSDNIGEIRGLGPEMPEKVEELPSKCDTWNVTLSPPLWGGGRRDNGA